MEIRIKCGCGEGGCSEWAIVEVQGVVESQPSIGERIQNLEIGRLCCCCSSSSPSSSSYTFTVGYHELSGTKMPLKKPVVVLQKKRNPQCSSGVEMEVVGIIRHRILFKNRPKALISKPVVKEKKTSQPSLKYTELETGQTESNDS